MIEKGNSFLAFVLRIWQEHEDSLDTIVLTWGVNLSGLVYLGNKLSNIQPALFNSNTVIFKMRGGYFTSYITLRIDLPKPLPYIDHLNIISNETSTKVYRCIIIQTESGDIKNSYNVKKLQRLHSLQISIRNKTIDAQMVRDKINVICGLTETKCQASSTSISANPSSSVRYEPQLLTMNSLNKMLQVRPSTYRSFSHPKNAPLMYSTNI